MFRFRRLTGDAIVTGDHRRIARSRRASGKTQRNSARVALKAGFFRRHGRTLDNRRVCFYRCRRAAAAAAAAAAASRRRRCRRCRLSGDVVVAVIRSATRRLTRDIPVPYRPRCAFVRTITVVHRRAVDCRLFVD